MAEYIEYHPLKFWLDPASIAEIVAHIQSYLVDNPINSTTEIETIIHDYLIAHPDIIGGVRSINGETGEVVLTADNISGGENVTIKDVLDSLQNQIDDIVASIPSDYQQLIDDVSDLKSDINVVNNLLDIDESEQTIYKSLAQDTTGNSSNSVSPFIVSKLDYGNAPYNITSIKLNINRIGTLSVGKVLKTDVTQGGTYDSTKFIVTQVLQITSTGVQTIPLTPIEITDEYYFFFCARTDTAQFRYGGSMESGLTQGFLYASDTTFTYGASFLGIDLIALVSNVPANIRETIRSIYFGKTLSILGDSISTFSGYIPDGNLTYYPSGTVTAVTDTWWKKLIDALGMELEVNNSWSGSRVTTTVGDTSAGCMTRCEALGTSPDVIIVWMGINDFNNNVALGTYDGSSAIPQTTITFREAYGIMLNKILTKYHTSEVWVCTLPQCERNGTEGFPEINGNNVALVQFNKAIEELAQAFGVKVLDHNRCGLTYQNMDTYNPDELHPNKFGHSLVANNDIRQMDAAVCTRYSIT